MAATWQAHLLEPWDLWDKQESSHDKKLPEIIENRNSLMKVIFLTRFQVFATGKIPELKRKIPYLGWAVLFAQGLQWLTH